MKPCLTLRWKLQAIIACCALLLAIVPAFALTSLSKVTPDWTKEMGITVQTEKREDGTIAFTVTRYIEKGPQVPADSEWTILRTANLSVANQTGMLSSTQVNAKVEKDTLIYWFTLSPACIPYSHFTLNERADYKDPNKQNLLPGGGAIHEFDLPAFAASLTQRKAPEHP